MTRPVPWVAAAICASVLVSSPHAGSSPTQAQSGAQFRSGAEIVSVDALVRAGGQPVAGLTSDDFELRDNNVVQQIDAISAGAAPLDLTLLMDTSGSTTAVIDEMKDYIRQMAKLLRAEDRIRLITFGDTVREVFPLRPASGKLPLDAVEAGGSTALCDAVLLALMHAPAPGRRQLIVMFTDGGENSSVASLGSVVEAVTHADAVLHIAILSAFTKIEKDLLRAGVSAVGLGRTLEDEERIDALRGAAEATGGALSEPDASSKLVDRFRKVLDDFRGSYLLRYTPRNVAAGGWHAITVRVTRPGVFAVSARKGYFRN